MTTKKTYGTRFVLESAIDHQRLRLQQEWEAQSRSTVFRDRIWRMFYTELEKLQHGRSHAQRKFKAKKNEQQSMHGGHPERHRLELAKCYRAVFAAHASYLALQSAQSDFKKLCKIPRQELADKLILSLFRETFPPEPEFDTWSEPKPKPKPEPDPDPEPEPEDDGRQHYQHTHQSPRPFAPGCSITQVRDIDNANDGDGWLAQEFRFGAQDRRPFELWFYPQYDRSGPDHFAGRFATLTRDKNTETPRSTLRFHETRRLRRLRFKRMQAYLRSKK